MNKRGLSTIIITLILIVVSLVAVAIFWVVVRNLISQQSEGISFEKFALSMDIKKVYSPGANDVAVEVERNPGKAELSGINFIFYTESGSELIKQNIPIGELETKTFTLTLQNITAADITKVSIAPIFKANSEIGSIAASYELTGPMESGSYVCTPNSCSALGYNCGSGYANGTCSGTLSCGTCPSGQSCVSGVCQAGACTPTTCSALGHNCGTWVNGTCSGTLNCGTCPTGQSCNASGMCVAGSCTPTTCSTLGFNCGTPANGTCSGTLNCGSCIGGQTCSNSSGGICQAGACTPTSCSALGYNCGSWGNGTCSGTLNCGTCSGGQTCVSGHCQATGDLIAYYPFSGNANDASGNGNNGIVTGPVLTTDKNGNANSAYFFDGYQDFIDCGNNSILNPDYITVSVWVKPNEVRTIDKYIFYKQYTYFLDAMRNFNNVSHFYVYNSTSDGTSVYSNSPLTANQWTHIAATYNGTTAIMYINGVQRGLTIPSLGPLAKTANYLYIGYLPYSSLTFNGTIDELRIYNRALSLSEIISLNNSY